MHHFAHICSEGLLATTPILWFFWHEGTSGQQKSGSKNQDRDILRMILPAKLGKK
jgi:hypothetical protein